MNRKHLMWRNKWLSKNNRKPLVVRGARQVGKSALGELLAGSPNRELNYWLRFDLNPPGRQTVSTRIKQAGQVRDIAYELQSLPLYLVERLPDLL